MITLHNDILFSNVVLTRALPPEPVLLVGCGDGGLAGLLRLAGYAVSVLALAPDEVAVAGSYGVAAFERLEALGAAPGSFGAVLLQGGLDALADAEASLGACAAYLRPGGIFVGPAAGEEAAARDILGRIGFGHVVFGEGGVFAAGAGSLPEHGADAIRAALEATPDGRMALAMLALGAREAACGEALGEALSGERHRDAGLEGVVKEMSSGWVAEARLPGIINRTLGRIARFNWFFVKLAKYGLRERGRFLPRPEGHSPSKMCVAVDLTPVLPGGDNGGAKLLTVNLLLALRSMRPDWHFVCLTADSSHEELTYLDGPNMERIRASGVGRMKGFSEWRGRKIDLMFCPFTMPYYYHPEVPVVSIVYDLQYAYYPQFFSSEEEAGREKTFMTTARRASKLVCISDFVRRTVLEKGGVPANRAHTAYIGLPQRLAEQPEEIVTAALARLGLQKWRYLLYPANFWAHKNHEMLLTAFNMYVSRHGDSDLKLALTGADTGKRAELGEAVTRMGLADRVVFTGYVSDEDMGALMQVCAALIFPSLFEGFGMPVLEAMTLGRPVLCSDVTSLPEVGGDAALYFDPKRPEEIVAAIERLESDPEYVAAMIEKGRGRAAVIGGPREMAGKYAAIFEEAVRRPLPQSFAIKGVEADGWARERIFAAVGPGAHRQWMEVGLCLPEAAVSSKVSLEVLVSGKVAAGRSVLERGRSRALSLDVPACGGYVEILIESEAAPGFSGGQGRPGCRVDRLVLTDGEAAYDLLPCGEDRP